MIFHQPFKQLDLLGLQTVALGKVSYIRRAQQRVIAAATLGNIVI